MAATASGDDASMSERDDLRGISNRLIAHIADLHALEQRSRAVPIGSAELARLSAGVTALSRDILRLAAEQESVGRRLSQQPTTIEQLDASEANDNLSAPA
jgi:hypothetical protein